MNTSDTPETDANTWSDSSEGILYKVVSAEISRKLERERDEANEELSKKYVEYDQLFDEAEKIKIELEMWRDGNIMHEIHQTELEKVEQERDEAREKIKRQAERIRYLEGATNHACGTPLSVVLIERDEARENLDQEMKFHHRTHAELVQTQCKLLDMEMKCDQLQDEIKRLKIILDLIKRDVS